MTKRVLITGVGGVGVFAAHMLARMPDVELYLGDIREDYLPYKTNAILDNAFYSYSDTPFPKVHTVIMDMMDVDATARQLDEIKPDVVLHLASLLAAQKIREGLPVEIAKTIYDANPVGTGLRPWAPGHAVLLLNLMKAIRKAGIETHVVNGSGCDFLHLSFSKLGLTPTCGLGDFALLEPGLRRIIAELKGLQPRDLTIYMGGHHSIVMPLGFFGDPQGVPYYLKVEALGEDITQEINFERDVFPQMPKQSSWPPLAGAADQEQTSAHGVRIVRAIIRDTQEILNVPAPEGQPGCYPARVGAHGATITAPPGITREELIEINSSGNIAEGFKEIREDGTMVATDRTVELIEKTFEIDWQYKEFKPDEAFEAFKEINRALADFKERFKSGQV